MVLSVEVPSPEYKFNKRDDLYAISEHGHTMCKVHRINRDGSLSRKSFKLLYEGTIDYLLRQGRLKEMEGFHYCSECQQLVETEGGFDRQGYYSFCPVCGTTRHNS